MLSPLWIYSEASVVERCNYAPQHPTSKLHKRYVSNSCIPANWALL